MDGDRHGGRELDGLFGEGLVFFGGELYAAVGLGGVLFLVGFVEVALHVAFGADGVGDAKGARVVAGFLSSLRDF